MTENDIKTFLIEHNPVFANVKTFGIFCQTYSDSKQNISSGAENRVRFFFYIFSKPHHSRKIYHRHKRHADV